MLMLYQQYETVATALSEQFSDVGNLFSSGLNDESIKVRVMALKACGALIEYLALDPKVMTFRELVPQMITVVEQCVSCGVNDAAVQALEVFGEMAGHERKKRLRYVSHHRQLSLRGQLHL